MAVSLKERCYPSVIVSVPHFISLDDAKLEETQAEARWELARPAPGNRHMNQLCLAFHHALLIQDAIRKCFYRFREYDRLFCQSEDTSVLLSGKTTFMSQKEAEYFANILSSPPTFLVCGEVNVGKSSFINCLLGEELLPVDEAPLTSRVITVTKRDSRCPPGTTVIRQREEAGWDTADKHVVTDVSEVQIILSDLLDAFNEESLKKGTSATEPASRTFIQVEMEHPLLHENVTIVECPAIDGPDTHQVVLDQLRSNPLTMIIYIMDVTDLMTKVTEQFLTHIASIQPPVPIFFVLSKVDAEDDDEVNQRDRKEVWTAAAPTKSPSTEAPSCSSTDHVKNVFKTLAQMDCLLRVDAENCEADNFAPVSLLSSCGGEEVDADLINLLRKLSTWTKTTFWRLLSSTYCKMYLMIHAVTRAVFSRQLLEVQCHEIRNLFQQLQNVNRERRRLAVNKVKSVLEREKQRILQKLMDETTAGFGMGQRRPMAKWLTAAKTSKIGTVPESSSRSSAFRTQKSTPQPPEREEEQFAYQMEKRVLREVDLCMAKQQDILRDIAETRTELLDLAREKMRVMFGSGGNNPVGILVEILLWLLHWKSHYLTHIRFLTNSKSIFGEEKLLRQLRQAWSRIVSPAMSTATVDVTPQELAALQMTGSSGGLPVLTYKQRLDTVESILRRVRADRIVRENFEVFDELMQLMISHVTLFVSVQKTILHSASDFFDEPLHIKSFATMELMVMALRVAIERGFWKCEAIPLRALNRRPCLFNITSVDDDAQVPAGVMIRRLKTGNFSHMTDALNAHVFPRLCRNRLENVLPIMRCSLDYENNLLLMAPRMDTDLFLVLKNHRRYARQIHFHEARVRLHIFTEVVKGCAFLVNTFKDTLSIDLRPENILMSQQNVKLYVLENAAFDRPYPDHTGPYMFKITPRDSSDPCTNPKLIGPSACPPSEMNPAAAPLHHVLMESSTPIMPPPMVFISPGGSNVVFNSSDHLDGGSGGGCVAPPPPDQHQVQLNIQFALLLWWLNARKLCAPPRTGTVESSCDMRQLAFHLPLAEAQEVLAHPRSLNDKKLVKLMQTILCGRENLHLSGVQLLLDGYRSVLSSV